jgi:hypothetical protein
VDHGIRDERKPYYNYSQKWPFAGRPLNPPRQRKESDEAERNQAATEGDPPVRVYELWQESYVAEWLGGVEQRAEARW